MHPIRKDKIMKRSSRIAIAFFVALFWAFAVQAAGELKNISTEELSKGVHDKKLFVVDCNTDKVFQEGHIPGAVHMDVMNPDAKLLPQDKSAALVFYCMNPRCMASHKGAEFAQSQGYANVRVYSPGIQGWEKAGMKVEK